MILKLGTRKSLLARAQSTWIARQLESRNPGLGVQLVGIDTLNDRTPNASLYLIDEALLSGRVDFTVHAMKDLSFERPREIRLAAIPQREDPRDVVLFSPDITERLRQGLPIRLGGSSPRRLENVTGFLERALPKVGPAPRLRWADVRGGIDTRLSCIRLADTDPLKLDALIFAFAAPIRLWRDEAMRNDLRPLLSGLRWMVLPLSECPGAPGQGALALECRSSDGVTLPRLKKLHDPLTARLVSMEREVLHHWSEMNPQRFGAAALCTDDCGDVLFLRGVRPDGAPLSEVWTQTPHSRQKLQAAHQHPDGLFLSPTRLWTCNAQRWTELAADGLWVEGCADGLGLGATQTTRNENVLGAL